MGWSGDEPAVRRERVLPRLSMEQCCRQGGNRKLVDSVGCTLAWVKRVCFSLAAIGFLLTVSSVARETFSAALFYPRKLVSSQQQLRLNYLRVGQEYVPGRPVITTERQTIPLPLDAPPTAEDDDRSIRVKRFGTATVAESFPVRPDDQQPYIEDIVSLPERMDLILVRQFTDLSLRDRLTSCRYGESQIISKILNADFVDGRLAITCIRPEEFAVENFTVTNITIEVDDGDSATLTSKMEYSVPARWDAPLVYAVVATKEDVIIFVKGVFDKRKLGDYANLSSFRCVFGRGIESEVTAGAQELYRCASPKFGTKDVLRQKVYLRYKGHLIPSVAYYDRSLSRKFLLADEEKVLSPPMEPGHKHLICSCTMIWNAAKFMKEWILYNSHLGVDKFFLYDNNSEDDIEGVVGILHEYNVTRQFWPWVKTQEAGFSHCAVRAAKECVWVLFADVDEYMFPKHWLPKLSEPSLPPKSRLAIAEPFPRHAFRHLIQDTQGKVTLKTKLLRPKAVTQTLGQISVFCRNFGPSGWSAHPPRGVTQSYICRDQREQRHKSLVLLRALKPSLANVIHHFDLKPEYMTMYIDPRHAVINHYKFQAWPEFETKFTKRASTYVADWKEPVNLNSRDRPDGVGPDAIKPENWESSHCFKNDTSLRDYTRSVFQVKQGENAGKLEWELL